ncbi:MAG TPA: hypothetical protein VFF60_03495 [Candidatus Binatus sp.]|nr:hypothetical protein [Candidatus Binatus sp.]
MIATYIVPILVVSGVCTMGIIALTFAPRAVSRAIFGVEATDALTIFLARYTGVLVFLFGGLIVVSAFHPEIRRPVLIAACVEKLTLVFFVLSRRLRPTPLMIAAAAADSLFTVLYLAYLASTY